MRIIKPSFEILTDLNPEAVLKHIELCGRTCYKSEKKITDESCRAFVKSIISRGHEAVLEHFNITVKFICDRGVSHEIVRHRLASYCQESTRYCNYSKDDFNSEITVIEPFYLQPDTFAYNEWKRACEASESAYFNLLEWGCTPQEARAVLPNSLKTEVVMTANLREWRHFFKLRCAKAAHPQMREVAIPLCESLQKNYLLCLTAFWRIKRMNIDVSKIVSDKLEQLDTDGVIKRKIEETVEKTVTDAITSELSSYTFRNGISKQVQDSVSKIAADCGFSAYNGFIAQTVKIIVQDLYSADIAEKVQQSLNDVLLQKHENISLSEIFKRYRDWVLENTDESEKYERQEYTADLEVKEDGNFTHYTCRFADHPLESGYFGGKERGEIEVRFCVYGEKKTSTVSSLYLNSHDLKNTLKTGNLSTFEAFVANLYYNSTEILLDVEEVDDDTSFDIDY